MTKYRYELEMGDVLILRDKSVGIAFPAYDIILYQDGTDSYSEFMTDINDYFGVRNNSYKDENDIMRIYRPLEGWQMSFETAYENGKLIFQRRETSRNNTTVLIADELIRTPIEVDKNDNK
jgi:hypothetical protein